MASYPPHELSFAVIGTFWRISLYQKLQSKALERLLAAIQQRIRQFDANYSRFRDDSLVAAMSRQAGTYHLPDDAKPLLDLYRKLYQLTGGAVSPLVGQLLEQAGYDAAYSLQPRRLQAVPEWEEVLDYDFPQLTLKQPALLDFGAAGKGYLVDIICELIRRSGIGAYCVDAGGDIRQYNVPEAEDRIGLEHPSAPGQVIGVASIGNGSLCGSSGNRRRWGQGQAADGGDLHHIMDPRRRLPVRGIAALWAAAPSALLADGLATALYFVPAERLAADFNFEYLILYDSPAGLSAQPSAGFPAELFSA